MSFDRGVYASREEALQETNVLAFKHFIWAGFAGGRGGSRKKAEPTFVALASTPSRASERSRTPTPPATRPTPPTAQAAGGAAASTLDGDYDLTGKKDREGRDIVKEGYVGKAKGMKQILWERGLWKDGMVKRLEEDAEDGLGLSMYHVLSDCWDFATETTALMEKLRARGHVLLMCVKCHPELEGVGIENTWGKSAMQFRQHNDCVAKHLDADVLQVSLHSDNLPLSTIRKFARRTRDYLRAYMSPDERAPHRSRS